MTTPLIPEARADKDGKVVTRWVKVLETGEPAIPIPAPKSPDQKHLSESLFAKMYVDINEENGYLIDVCGREVYYTYEFTEHALNLLPTKTLKMLAKHLTDDNGSEQSYLMMPLFSYVDSMYERENDEQVEALMTAGVTAINNALVFHEPLGRLSKYTNGLRMAEDYADRVNTLLERYEGTQGDRTVEYEPSMSKTDYLNLPKEIRERAVAYVAASYLTSSFGEKSWAKANDDAVDLVHENKDRLEEIAVIASKRGFNDIGLIREILNSDVSSLSDGIL